MMKWPIAALVAALTATRADAQINAGQRKTEPSLPFTITQVATFNLPWRIAFLPDGRMLVTEKVGPVWLVTSQGAKTPVANAPAVLHQGQGGMLGIFLSPRYATDHNVYLTYSEPGEGGSPSTAGRPMSLDITGPAGTQEFLAGAHINLETALTIAATFGLKVEV